MTYAEFLKITANYSVDDLTAYISSISAQRKVPGFLSYMSPLFATYVLSYTTGKYLYFDPTLAEIVGFDLIELQRMIPNPKAKIWFAPDQKIQNELIMANNLAFFRQLPPKEHDQYLITTNYRVRHKQGHLINLQQQSYYIRTAPDGTPLVTFGRITDISQYRLDNVISHAITYVGNKPSNDKAKFYKEYFAQDDMQPTHISDRGKQILKLISDGLKDLEIAEELALSVKTIEQHKAHLRKKFRVKTTAELIAKAKKENWI